MDSLDKDTWSHLRWLISNEIQMFADRKGKEVGGNHKFEADKIVLNDLYHNIVNRVENMYLIKEGEGKRLP